ncbi:MAG: AsmA family protein, partial [Burkholderiales bacterium]|nr:AsmA family protein [Burkholderiales bacterium]
MLLSQLPTRLRRALYAVAAVLALIVAMPLVDLVPIKQRIVHDASDSLGRKVAVGAVRFALLPSPNVTLEDVSMTEQDGRTPFARWESARFSLGWTALWHGRAELVDGRIQGLWVSVKAMGAGYFNVDDLLTRRPKSNRIDWRPQRVDLVGAALDWQDVDGRVSRLRNVDLHAINPETDNGAVTLQGQLSAPDWGGGLRLDSGLHVDRPNLTAQLPGFKLRINADVPDWREGHTDLNGDVVLSALPWRSRIDHAQVHAMAKHGDQLWQLAFDAAQLRLDERGFSTDALEGELGIKGTSRELAGRWKIQQLAANETGALVAQTTNLHAQLLDEDQNAQMDLAGTLHITDWRRLTLDDYTLTGSYHHKALPRGAIKLALGGSLQLDLGRERLNWDSHGTLDGAPITTQFSLENFIDTKYVLGLDLGKLDLTPYLPSSGDKGPGVDTAHKLNFDWLHGLDARADVKLGELDLGRFRVFNLQTH